MSKLTDTLKLRAFGLLKIPMLFVAQPVVIEASEKRSEIKIPLGYWTKNHLNSMYFGVLAMGADCAGGLLAMNMIGRSKKNIQLVFKDFKADFLKLAKADTHFICEEGEKSLKALKETIKTKKRVNVPLHITATTPEMSGDEPVAKFVLTLSLKAKS